MLVLFSSPFLCAHLIQVIKKHSFPRPLCCGVIEAYYILYQSSHEWHAWESGVCTTMDACRYRHNYLLRLTVVTFCLGSPVGGGSCSHSPVGGGSCSHSSVGRESSSGVGGSCSHSPVGGGSCSPLEFCRRGILFEQFWRRGILFAQSCRRWILFEQFWWWAILLGDSSWRVVFIGE